MATKKTTPAEPAPTTTYTVISPLEHDLVPYAIDDEVDLTDKQAEPLLGRAVKAKTPEAA